MATFPRLFICALLFAMAGCMVPPDYHPPAVELPAGWSEAPEGTLPAASPQSRWWRTFQDPELDSLVERALRSNLDLQLAEARVREARARGGAAGTLWPSLDATASYARERESKNAPAPVLVRPNGEVEPPGPPENLFLAGFDATWEIDFFGGTRRAIEASQAEFHSSLFDRGGVVLTLVGEVCRNYFELRGAQRQLTIASQTAASQRETLELVRSRYAAGMATGVDVARGEAQLQRTLSQLHPLETTSRKAVNRLALLLGEPIERLREELRPERIVPLPDSEPPLGLPSDLLRQRPDIRSAERRVAAASAKVGAATADLYPKFTLLGKAGIASESAGDFFSGDSAFWSIGPSISWPIFKGGQIKANIEVRDAQLQQALINYRRAILAGIEDVENGVTEYRHERARRGALLKASESERQAFCYARDRYAAGLVDLRDVLDAQRALYEVRSELARSESSLLLDLVALYKALGGGWMVPVPAESGAGLAATGGRK